MRDIFQGFEVGKSFDFLQTGMEALAHGGTFALVGMGAECCPDFSMHTLVTKEADFRGCFRYTNIVRHHSDCLCRFRVFSPSCIMPRNDKWPVNKDPKWLHGRYIDGDNYHNSPAPRDLASKLGHMTTSGCSDT